MYSAGSTRYDTVLYRRCGASGVQFPAISLGLWHNFGGVDVLKQRLSWVVWVVFDEPLRVQELFEPHQREVRGRGDPGATQSVEERVLGIDLLQRCLSAAVLVAIVVACPCWL